MSSDRRFCSSKLCQMLLVLCSFLLAPVIVIGLVCLYIYRSIVEVRLRTEYKDKFAGFLDGSDCIWAIEESTALSVINVLVIVEKDARHSNIAFLESIRTMVKERMVDSPYKKLLYSRRKKYGYFFWEKNDRVDLGNRVRWLEYERTSCDGSCDNVYNGHLKRILRNVCNQPLPDGHAASWEILVGKSCPRSSYHYLRRMEERLKNGRIRIPILFRVHHSLADGTALLKFFSDIVADKERIQVTLPRVGELSIKMNSGQNFDTVTVTVPQLHRSDTCLNIKEHSVTYCYQKDVLEASMPFTYFVTFASLAKSYLEIGSKYFRSLTMEQAKQEVWVILGKQWNEAVDFIINEVYEQVKTVLRTVMVVIAAPICLVRQTLRSMEDKSALHGPKLSGEKVISYWMEDDFRNSYEQRLLTKIQSIKYITGAKFGDVVLAALSASLHKYFLRVDKVAPNRLTAVLPHRMGEPGESFSLQNNFSVGLLPLCISEIKGAKLSSPSEDPKTLERLQDIKMVNEKLESSPDYMVNFAVIKHLSALLPEDLLRPFLDSHSTMVFSHLPGLREVQILGHSVKNVTFWIPNRSYTGIGCSLLSYRGYLHLSLMADKALVKDEKLLTEILENTVHEIDDLYDRLTLSSFSKKFHSSAPTPMRRGIGVL